METRPPDSTQPATDKMTKTDEISFGLTDPDATLVTIAISLPLGDWRKARHQIHLAGWLWPLSTIARRIDYALNRFGCVVYSVGSGPHTPPDQPDPNESSNTSGSV